MKSLAALAFLFVSLSVRQANADAPVVQVWYRSSEACPEGAAFIARLGALGRKAKLASAGDRVDFVVTLGPAPASTGNPTESLGRLERQTASGTVAIRELKATSCPEVAEALALSLELALAPESDAIHAPAAAAANASESVGAIDDVAALPDTSSTSRHGRAVHLGAQGTVTTGVAPAPMPGLALFLALGGEGGPAARLAVRAGYRESQAESTDLQMTLIAGRLEGCPWSWSRPWMSVETCAAVDVGALRAESPGPRGRSDSGVWFGGAASVRAAFPVGSRVSVEAEVGALLPFVRYDFASEVGSARLFRTAAAGLTAGLGAVWDLE